MAYISFSRQYDVVLHICDKKHIKRKCLLKSPIACLQLLSLCLSLSVALSLVLSLACSAATVLQHILESRCLNFHLEWNGPQPITKFFIKSSSISGVPGVGIVGIPLSKNIW